MITSDVLILIEDDPHAHGVLADHQEKRREVFCTVRSAGRSEVYQAKAEGLQPSLVFGLSLDEDYHGEMRLEYRDERYRVIRTYTTDDGGIEIVVERDANSRTSGNLED